MFPLLVLAGMIIMIWQLATINENIEKNKWQLATLETINENIEKNKWWLSTINESIEKNNRNYRQ